MRWIAATLLTVALAVTISSPSAFAKGKPATKQNGKVTSTAGVNAGGFQCTNAFEMQSNDEYTLVCFACPTAPDGPAGAIVWVPQLWAVVRGADGAADAASIAGVQFTFGCGDWYYFA